MAIVLEASGNGVLFNGALTEKQGWVLSHNGQTPDRCLMVNKKLGLSGSGLVTEVEVDGETFNNFNSLVDAVSILLYGGEE